MKVKQLYFFTVLSIMATIGCTDLEEGVYDAIPSENYPETSDQIAVEHLASYNALYQLWDDVGYWFLTQEVSSDEMVAPTRGNHWFDGGKWLALQYHSWNDESDAVTGIWRELLIGIVKSNDIIEDLMSYEVVPMDKVAEVRTIRAFYFFMLMDTYGDVPYITEHHPDPNNAYRNHKAAVYDSLVMTLENAYPLLPSIANPSYKHYASKEMAQALLAKLYLNAEVYKGSAAYDKAGQICDSLIANPSLALDSDVMNVFSVDNPKPSEVIFSVPFNETDKTGFRLHMRSLHYENNATYDMAAGPWNGFCVIPTLFDSFEDKDKRKEGYFQFGYQYTITGAPIIMNEETGDTLYIDPAIPFAYMPSVDENASYTNDFATNCGARVQKFEIYQGAKENLIVNFPVYRLSDIYLMKAEVELRTVGSVSVATLDLVNQIRIRAGVDAWAAADVDLDAILAERGRELFGEAHRRVDQIRFGTYTEPFWNKGDGIDANDPGANAQETTFPIPLSATTTNPNLDLPAQ